MLPPAWPRHWLSLPPHQGDQAWRNCWPEETILWSSTNKCTEQASFTLASGWCYHSWKRGRSPRAYRQKPESLKGWEENYRWSCCQASWPKKAACSLSNRPISCPCPSKGHKCRPRSARERCCCSGWSCTKFESCKGWQERYWRFCCKTAWS